MTLSITIAARVVALAFALISVGGAAVAQGVPQAKKPTVGGKPIVQAKPSTPMGCKLVGTVKGTKICAAGVALLSAIIGASRPFSLADLVRKSIAPALMALPTVQASLPIFPAIVLSWHPAFQLVALGISHVGRGI